MAEDNRYWNINTMDGLLQEGLREWAEDGVLLPLVDEDKGGVIGYIHKDSIDEVTNKLNYAEKMQEFLTQMLKFHVESLDKEEVEKDE